MSNERSGQQANTRPPQPERRSEPERRGTWDRCASLLKAERDERREAEQTAVLGYN